MVVAVDPEIVERRKGRERKGRPIGRYLMCVHVRDNRVQLTVLEGRSLIEHYVSLPSDDVYQIHGNIYVGRVQNVLPGMEAAFIEIGTPKNAVLYRGDVQYDREDLLDPAGTSGVPRIEDVLRPRQLILCQVTKNPIGAKGARLTQEVSLPGRFVVLIPNSSTYGISKRLSDDERKRLFAQRGVRTAGGITLTIDERNRFETFCYSDPGHRQWVQQVVEHTARHFDEVILDDFFFTSCKSDVEIRARGGRSWTDYRLELLDEAARNVILAPARKVNPKVKVVIKYPNWYDPFHGLGFNLEKGPQTFDAIYTGTETRDAVRSASTCSRTTATRSSGTWTT